MTKFSESAALIIAQTRGRPLVANPRSVFEASEIKWVCILNWRVLDRLAGEIALPGVNDSLATLLASQYHLREQMG
jgi:hypothetical protein